MVLKASIVFDYVDIMLLTSLNISVFHVKHSSAVDQISYFRLERCHPELGGNLAHQGHQAREVLTIELGRRIIQQ